MKVILLENVRKIGSIGEIIDVKRGFARNFLIANKKAFLFAIRKFLANPLFTSIISPIDPIFLTFSSNITFILK